MDKMVTILQLTYANAFSSMTNFVLRLKFIKVVFPDGPIENKTALVQAMAWQQAITQTNADPVHRRA